MQAVRIVCRLAWRNLWRNYRRTLVMLSAIVIGVWAMIFMTALMRGMVDSMVRDGIRALPGHVQIHQPGFRDDPTVSNLMPMPDAALAAALQADDVITWTSRVRVPAVITSERDSRGVTLVGIEPNREAGISFIADDLSDGRYLGDSSDQGLILGRKLIDRLDTELGKRVVVMTQDPDNEIVDRGFRIVGVFESRVARFEELYAFTGRSTLQAMLGVGDRISEIALNTADYRDVESVHGRIASAAGQDLEVLPWQELDSYLGTMVGVMDGFVLVFIVVIFLALSFGLVNTLVMAVFERVREIGLMLALGMRPAAILGQIVVEALLLLAIGLVLGNALAWLTLWPIRDGIDLSIVAEGMELMGAASVITPSLNGSDMLLASTVVIVLGFFASLSPAWRASRYEPVDAITKV